MDIVRNIATLKRFEKKGLIKLHRQTGTKITGLNGGKPFTCYYIDSAKTFEENGYKYYEEYFSGCFFPYLVYEKIKK